MYLSGTSKLNLTICKKENTLQPSEIYYSRNTWLVYIKNSTNVIHHINRKKGKDYEIILIDV